MGLGHCFIYFLGPGRTYTRLGLLEECHPLILGSLKNAPRDLRSTRRLPKTRQATALSFSPIGLFL